MGLCVVGVQRTLAPEAAHLEFLVSVAVGAVAYLLAVALIVTRFRWDIDRNLRTVVDSVT
jgi:hypothetical protein